MERRNRSLAAGLAATVTLIASPALAAPGGVEVSADLGVYSAHVTRGMVMNDEPVVETGIGMSSGVFAFRAAGFSDLTDRQSHSGEFTEIDVEAGLRREVGAVELNGGYLLRRYPVTDVDSHELFASASTTRLPVEASAAVYLGVGDTDGAYARLGAGYGMPVAPIAALNLTAHVAAATGSYHAQTFAVDEGSLSDAGLRAAVDVSFPNGIQVSPSLSYTAVLNSTIGDALSAASVDEDHVTFGLQARVSF